MSTDGSSHPAATAIFNTLSRRLERLEPRDAPNVGIYACGPTVYDYAHIGNFRYFVWVDVLRRYLRWRGFSPRLVMNLTDVDDNTIGGAKGAGVELGQYTRAYIDAFFADLDALGIERADVYPRATEHIDEMVELVGRLLESGHAYELDGSVYFRISSFPTYGHLARLQPDQLRSAERTDSDAYTKEDIRDFVLWKAPKEEEPSWDTAVGTGRPGWHLECSAMSMKYLGESFDVHVGGEDLIFPHHQNEIAQSEAATGRPFVRYWMHCAHLITGGVKMSKSLGNHFTLRDLLEGGHDATAIRYLLASVHYRRPLNFGTDALEQATAAVGRLREFIVRARDLREDLEPDAPSEGGLADAFADAKGEFVAALDNDLNTAGALGAVFSLVRDANAALDRRAVSRDDIDAIVGWLHEIDTIWGVLDEREATRDIVVDAAGQTLAGAGPDLGDEIIGLIEARLRARAKRDFAAADRIRDDLDARGVIVEDTPRGVRWSRKR